MNTLKIIYYGIKYDILLDIYRLLYKHDATSDKAERLYSTIKQLQAKL